MSDFSIHREVQHLTERLYKLERDTRTILDVKDARIADLEAVIWQLSRDPEMADVYVLAQINIENKARIAELEAYKTAFFAIGAEIAKSGCCTHTDLDAYTGNVHCANCTREKLMVLFLAARKALESGE